MADSVIPGSQEDIARAQAVLDRINAKAAPDDAISLLREMAQDVTDCRRYLGRLVAMEEERREGERQMEALAEALQSGAPEQSYLETLDWYRDRSGDFRIRSGDGSDPLMTQKEIEYVTHSPRRAARERQSR